MDFLRRIDPRLIVLAVGLLLAAGVVLTDDRDPIVFAIPVLVATTIGIVVLTLAGGGTAERRVREDAEAAGLAYDGMRAVPPVTGALREVRGTLPVASGPLIPDGPQVRVTRVEGRVVAITSAPDAPLDDAARELLDAHPLQARAEVEEGLLVVSASEDAPAADLLEVTRELHARLEVLAFSGR